MDTSQAKPEANRPMPDANAGRERTAAAKPTAARPRAQAEPVVQWQVRAGARGGQAKNVLASGASPVSQVVPHAQSALEEVWRGELLRSRQSDRQRFRGRRGQGVQRDRGGVVPPGVPGETAEAAPPAADGGRGQRLDYAPASGSEYARLDPGIVDDYGAAALRQKLKTTEEIYQPLLEKQQREWERFQQELRQKQRQASAQYYRPPTGTDLGSPGPAAAAQPAGAEQPSAGAGQTPDDAAAREAAFQRQLEAEQRLQMTRRELEGMDIQRQPERDDDERKFSERATKMTGRLAAAAQDANWPFYLVIALSVINDVFDIFDLGLLLGLDQVFDSLLFLMMLSARLFIRQGSGWITSKIAALVVEWIPLVGILPCWTIAAVYVWRRAVRMRQRRQGAAATAMAAGQAADADAASEVEEEPAYAEAGTSGAS